MGIRPLRHQTRRRQLLSRAKGAECSGDVGFNALRAGRPCTAPSTARKGECEGGTFDGFPHSRSVKDCACAVQFLQSKNCKPRSTRKKSPPFRVVIFGAGDEARTRYLDLGKVALYQMSYARKRKTYYTANRIPCQPCLPLFRKISARPLRGGQNRLNASRSPPRRHWRRWDRSSSPSRCRRWRSAPAARSAAPGTPARQRH